MTLALHSEETRREHEETLAWVRWIFQGIRARCEHITFQTSATNREGVVMDWGDFAVQVWQPILAPSLLRAWKAAHAEDLEGLLAAGVSLGKALPDGLREGSAAAGELLLRATQGAKYPGVLGRMRHALTQSVVDPHLAMVWAAVSSIFHVPPLDVLAEYLKEEWLTGLREHPQLHEPQGPLCFTALAQRALRESGFGGLAHAPG